MLEQLPGFRDFYPDACATRNFIFSQWAHVARNAGFAEYDIPTLEPLELFTRKSGEEIVGQLFHFVDKGEREVALRPELTPSLARMVGARAKSLKKPVKWFNIAENFRYERPQKGRLRSHYQLNCDIFGEADAGADVELISTCLNALRVFGLGADAIVLRLSDRRLWMVYLASLGLEEEASVGVLGVIDKWEREKREKLEERLVPYFGERTAETIERFEELMGVRDLRELELILRGRTTQCELIEQLEERLLSIREVLSSLEAMGLGDFVRLDLGIVRGLAYYTGFVFEVFEKTAEGTRGRALAGGGRYDHLTEKLGFAALPAVGFGMGDVTLTDLLEERKLLPPLIDVPEVYVVMGEGEARRAGLALVQSLRGNGFSVVYPLRSIGFGKQFKQAGQSGARKVVIVGAEEVESRTVKVKDLGSGEEETVPVGQLLASLRGERDGDG